MKIRTILGGKDPHPNWLVGGVLCPINMGGVGSVGALNMVSLNQIFSIIEASREFVKHVYIPDILAVGQFYKGRLYGGGLSGCSVLAYGDIPDRTNDYSPDNLLMPSGAIIDGNLKEVHEVDLRNPEEIQEFIPHSWYNYPKGAKGLHPWDGVTQPNFQLGPNDKGSKTNIEQIDESAKYSWFKASRWRGHAMEVGPLARYVVGYAKGHEAITE
jgi:hydrogenase large subunit